jgi:type IV pilus assembly protein PilA
MTSTLRKRLRKEEKGFTLIELLVVIIILGILTAIAIPSYLSFTGRAHTSAAKSNLRAVVPDVEAWYSDHNTYAGMNVGTLKSSYDQSLSTSIYSVVGTPTATGYCVSAKGSPNSTTVFYKQGPAAQMTTLACTGP